MFIYLIGILSGAALPVQTSINTVLRKRLGSPYLASLISFIGGVFCTILILACTGIGFTIPREAASAPWWVWFGGPFGCVLVTINLLAMKVLGSVETVIFSVLGQILTGIMIDHFGWFRAELIRITPLRLLGAALVVLGIILASLQARAIAETAGSSQRLHPSIKKTAAPAAGPVSDASIKMLYRFLAVCSGIATSTQVAINGYLGTVIGSPFRATLVSFSGGTLTCIIVCLILRSRNSLYEHGSQQSNGRPENRWWMWTGGALGVVCVVANVILARSLGTGLAVIISLIGQVAGGTVIDRTGFLGTEVRPVTIRKVAGLSVMIAGAAMIRLV